MTEHTTDQNVLGHIERLVAEEKKLHDDLSAADRNRLVQIDVELDRC